MSRRWHLWGKLVHLVTLPSRAFDHVSLKVWCWLMAYAEWDDNTLYEDEADDEAAVDAYVNEGGAHE